MLQSLVESNEFIFTHSHINSVAEFQQLPQFNFKKSNCKMILGHFFLYWREELSQVYHRFDFAVETNESEQRRGGGFI